MTDAPDLSPLNEAYKKAEETLEPLRSIADDLAAGAMTKEQALQAHIAKVREHLAALEDLNSAFPATQEFLRGRGLTNVRELDANGRTALAAFLASRLASLTHREPPATTPTDEEGEG